MDPDLVRQQEEAEREAMRLAGQKPGTLTPLAAPVTLQATAASAMQGLKPILPGDARPAAYHTQRAGLHSEEQSAAPDLAGAIGAGERAAPHLRPQPRPHIARSALWYFSEFLSFGFAGAMLGGGLGIVAANYMQLPIETAKLAIFGPAGLFALTCAFASFFTRRPDQPRASSGT
jgi:hypothetical protein